MAKAKPERGLLHVAAALVPGVGLARAFVDSTYEGVGEEWKKLAEEEYQQLVLELQQAVERLESELKEHGKRLEELSPTRIKALFEEWFKEVSKAYGEEKRQAITNATARQFDSRWLHPDARKYWLDQVKTLDDLEIIVLRRMLERPTVFYFQHPFYLAFLLDPSSQDEQVEQDEDLAVALAQGVLSLRKRGHLVDSNVHPNLHGQEGKAFDLSASGRVLARATSAL